MDMEVYVVDTNYDEYAVMMMRSLKPSEESAVAVRLYCELDFSVASSEAAVSLNSSTSHPARTKTVRDSLVEEAIALARHHGMGDEDIFKREDKGGAQSQFFRRNGMKINEDVFVLDPAGDCVPGEQVKESMASPEQRNRRSLEAELSLDQPEGSGMDPSFFNGTGTSRAGWYLPLLMQPHSLSSSLSPEACKAAPDTGPCFGLFQHYFYNSSSMSCELFNYGGCVGNQNNFKSERECLQRCRTEGEEHIPT